VIGKILTLLQQTRNSVVSLSSYKLYDRVHGRIKGGGGNGGICPGPPLQGGPVITFIYFK